MYSIPNALKLHDIAIKGYMENINLNSISNTRILKVNPKLCFLNFYNFFNEMLSSSIISLNSICNLKIKPNFVFPNFGN